jgi:putative membrane protein
VNFLLADVLPIPFPVGKAASLPGFIPGSRGSFMLDVVFLAMMLVVPVLGYSIYLVRVRKQYQLHKRIQLTLATVLLLAVTAFEVDMRFFTDWRALAEASPYFDKDHTWTSVVGLSLIVHLSFAIPTVLLWIVLIVQALRNFPSPPVPGPHSASHRLWGWVSTFGMVMTAVTGWIFYSLAFLATK